LLHFYYDTCLIRTFITLAFLQFLYKSDYIHFKETFRKPNLDMLTDMYRLICFLELAYVLLLTKALITTVLICQLDIMQTGFLKPICLKIKVIYCLIFCQYRRNLLMVFSFQVSVEKEGEKICFCK